VADHQDLLDAEVAHGADQFDQLRDVSRVEEHRRFVEDERGHRRGPLDALGEQSVDGTPQAQVEQRTLAARELVRVQRLAVLLVDGQLVVAVEFDPGVGVVLVDQVEGLVEHPFESLDVAPPQLGPECPVRLL